MKKPRAVKHTRSRKTQTAEFHWHAVTPLSKVLALILFIVFPVIGFLFGRLYEFSLHLK